MVLSKRGILDEGIYLTENGADLIKKIKTKPAPARRARPIKSTTDTTTATATAAETLGLDENSRSSCDEKPDNDENQASAETVHKKTLSAPPKRTILLGLGGFIDSKRIFLKGPSVVNFLCEDPPVELYLSGMVQGPKHIKHNLTWLQNAKKLYTLFFRN